VLLLIRLSFLAIVVVAFCIPAHAGLIYISPVDMTGTGLGHVTTILTIQNKDTESGCVGFGGSKDILGSAACVGGNVGGDEKHGASQTLTRLISETGALSAADLVLIFNPSEPAGNEVNLSNANLTIYSPSGALLFKSGTFTPVFFATTETGTGKSGFAFRLDSADAAAASAFFNSNNRIGLSATATESFAGLETFFVASAKSLGLAGAGGPSEIPEPASMLLLGAGLILVSVLRKRHA